MNKTKRPNRRRRFKISMTQQMLINLHHALDICEMDYVDAAMEPPSRSNAYARRMLQQIEQIRRAMRKAER